MAASSARPKSFFSGIPKGFIHNGGRMVVGPDDYLVRRNRRERNRTTLPGQEFTRREDPATQARRPTGTGNPFDNEVFSYGHRNVQGLAFDDAGRLWASEFGQNRWDELNLITKGADYGWPDGGGVRRRSRDDESEGCLAYQ